MLVMVNSRRLLYDAKPKMDHAGRGDRLDVFQFDRFCAQPIEQAHTSAEQDRRKVDVNFVNQSRP